MSVQVTQRLPETILDSKCWLLIWMDLIARHAAERPVDVDQMPSPFEKPRSPTKRSLRPFQPELVNRTNPFVAAPPPQPRAVDLPPLRRDDDSSDDEPIIKPASQRQPAQAVTQRPAPPQAPVAAPQPRVQPILAAEPRPALPQAPARSAEPAFVAGPKPAMFAPEPRPAAASVAPPHPPGAPVQPVFAAESRSGPPQAQGRAADPTFAPTSKSADRALDRVAIPQAVSFNMSARARDSPNAHQTPETPVLRAPANEHVSTSGRLNSDDDEEQASLALEQELRAVAALEVPP